MHPQTAHTKIKNGEGQCPECGGTNLRADLEAPRATCKECGETKLHEDMVGFLEED